MNRNPARSMGCAWIIIATAIALGGCGPSDSSSPSAAGGGTAAKSGKWDGTYESAKNQMSLVIQADHKGMMGPAGKAGPITWEAAGDDKIIVENYGNFFRTADGTLRDDDGEVWKKK